MENETVLITGASSGIGLELAEQFAKNGSDLVIVARRQSRLKEVAADLNNSFGVNVEVMVKDLSLPGSPKEIFDEIQESGREIDVLVNNAGFGAVGPFHEIDPGVLSDMLNVNLVSLATLTRLFLPLMVERNRGGILNVGSLAGFQPGPNAATYYATKSFVLSFSEALHDELKNSSVTVSCLCPGPVATEFGQQSGMDKANLFKTVVMDVGEVAREGYEGFRKGKAVVIPGKLAKSVPIMERFVPRSIARKIAAKLNQT